MSFDTIHYILCISRSQHTSLARLFFGETSSQSHVACEPSSRTPVSGRSPDVGVIIPTHLPLHWLLRMLSLHVTGRLKIRVVVTDICGRLGSRLKSFPHMGACNFPCVRITRGWRVLRSTLCSPFSGDMVVVGYSTEAEDDLF